MKNYKLLFFLESAIVFSLVFIFGYFSYINIFSEVWAQVLRIVFLLVLILIPLSIFLIWNAGVNFSKLKRMIDEPKNPLGITIRFFSYYLILAFPTNFIIMIFAGEESKYLFPANFILLLPFAVMGFVKGLFCLGK